MSKLYLHDTNELILIITDFTLYSYTPPYSTFNQDFLTTSATKCNRINIKGGLVVSDNRFKEISFPDNGINPYHSYRVVGDESFIILNALIYQTSSSFQKGITYVDVSMSYDEVIFLAKGVPGSDSKHEMGVVKEKKIASSRSLVIFRENL